MKVLLGDGQREGYISDKWENLGAPLESLVLDHQPELLKSEHLAATITRCTELLVAGGRLEIRILSVARLMEDYKLGKVTFEAMMAAIYDQNNKEEYQVPVSSIEDALKLAGFESVRVLTEDPDVLLLARKPITAQKDIPAKYKHREGSRVVLCTDFSEERSRGVLGGVLLDQMDRRGILVDGWQDPAQEKAPYIKEETTRYLVGFGKEPRTEKDILLAVNHIGWVSEYPIPFDKKYKAWGYFFHELTQLPPSWCRAASVYDKLWFPSTFCLNAARMSGLNKSLNLMPHGYNPTYIYPRKGNKTRWPQEFIFLSIAVQGDRKGTKLLIDTFLKFSTKNAVRLVLKDVPDSGMDYSGFKNHPKITIIQDILTKQEIGDLYRESDCFVLPTRSEGFCLPALEAKASKLPVIITGWGGHMDFCSEEDTYLIDYKLVPQSLGAPPEVMVSWADPVGNSLMELMDMVYNNKDCCRSGFIDNAYKRVSGMTWDACMEPLYRALREEA